MGHITASDQQQLDSAFTYHPPEPGQPERYVAIRDTAKAMVELIYDICPSSDERTMAVTRLVEAVMWANASIARNE